MFAREIQGYFTQLEKKASKNSQNKSHDQRPFSERESISKHSPFVRSTLKSNNLNLVGN